MKKFFGIVILATAISVPAYAQSFDPDNGTGNLVTLNTAPGGAIHQSATEVYAMSARRKVSAEASYAADRQDGGTGGGSAGYNEMLRNW